MATSQWVPKDTNVREVKLAKLGEGESEVKFFHPVPNIVGRDIAL